ncbi:diaminopimelate decarboxylase [cf. Phormidesmis sp. LEGE 11477]|uniref:diaminopimelate decarboxylase n=1 Tax=cf. Phormidesmis sp. LEGE 11477 TaxID=1828680 RepID=UPI0018818036|nr:diaminopimelate decarboxylase [cf. Phormidesmis sp. LEGE 11477]MBE9062067.1 diaminopimelate decarboxylase [cf. Phormidesmis sp. LEGE 11477]
MVSTISAAPTPSSLPASSRQYLTEVSDDTSPNQTLLPLTATVNDKDHLTVGSCDVVELLEEFGSPLYILDEQTLRTACDQYKQSFGTHYPGESLIVYASKAWNCLAVCALMAQEGIAIDVVSGGEISTAIAAGATGKMLYFHGNNKSTEELQLGLSADARIVVDNWHELKTLDQIAKNAQKTATILLRLTPGIECHTHEYIQTGHIDSKFGFDPDQLEEVFEFIANKTEHISCIGLHAHIGSQIFELQPHRDLAEVMMRWFQSASRYGLSIEEIDIGGGLGIRYTESDDPPSIDEWAQTVCQGMVAACEASGLPYPKLLCEPGRSLIGSACVTAYTVGGQKSVPGIRSYVSVDGGMSDNPRPITYQSVYRVLAASKMSAPLSETVTLAGKHCESGDVVIHSASLPPLESGDILVVPATGAYNYSMSSNYNRVPRPAAVMVNQGRADLILRRETYTDLMSHDCLPDALKPAALNPTASNPTAQ